MHKHTYANVAPIFNRHIHTHANTFLSIQFKRNWNEQMNKRTNGVIEWCISLYVCEWVWICIQVYLTWPNSIYVTQIFASALARTLRCYSHIRDTCTWGGCMRNQKREKNSMAAECWWPAQNLYQLWHSVRAFFLHSKMKFEKNENNSENKTITNESIRKKTKIELNNNDFTYMKMIDSVVIIRLSQEQMPYSFCNVSQHALPVICMNFAIAMSFDFDGAKTHLNQSREIRFFCYELCMWVIHCHLERY